MTVGLAAVRSWENGSYPLFCMGYDELRRLASALDQRHEGVRNALDELLLVSQCDLLLTGMLRGSEDYAKVPPIDEPGPEQDVIALTATARDQISGSHGDQLISFAAALAALIDG
jgi:hypothetical protein